MFDFSQYELFLMSCSIVLVFVVESCIAWIVWKKIILTGRLMIGPTIFVCWLAGALLSYTLLIFSMTQNNYLLIQQTSTFPLFNQLIDQVITDKKMQFTWRRYRELYYSQPLYSNDPLHYPLYPLHCESPDKPYNIILIK